MPTLPRLLMPLAGVCGLLLGACTTVRADEAADQWLTERLAIPVDLDQVRVSFHKLLGQLSDAIDVPIEIDHDEFRYSGIAFGQSPRLQAGRQPAGVVLRTFLLDAVYDDKLSFLVVPNSGKHPLKIVVTTRRQIQMQAPFVPPAEPVEARREITERFARKLNLDVEDGTLDRHFHLLGEKLGLPIDWHVESINQEGVSYNQSFSIAAGEKTAGELLALVVDRTAPDRKLSYFVAEDDRKRTPQRIRIVVASRRVIETNPARFSTARFRPITTGDDVEAALQKRVTLRVEPTDLVKAVRELSQHTGVRIRCSSSHIAEVVGIQAVDQPLGEVLKKLVDDAPAPRPKSVFVVFRRPNRDIELHVVPRAQIDYAGWLLPSVYDADAAATK